MKKFFTILFVALLPLVSFADEAEINGLWYNLVPDDNVAEVIEYKDAKYSGDIEIPSTIEYGEATYSVTSIGDYAFNGCIGLTSITIPNSVTSIGRYAFASCRGLTSVTIPNSLTSISNGIFDNCTGLTSVTIPNSVTSIGELAFFRCSGLTSITIPNSVTSISLWAFADCSCLTSVTIPNSVTSIGNGAFEGCSSLQYNEYDEAFYLGNDENPHVFLVKAKSTDITACDINARCKVIGSHAFEGCEALTSIAIPNSVTCIGFKAFYGCSSLQYNEYGEAFYLGNDENPYIVLVEAKSTDITACDINAKCKVIGYQAFHKCLGLTSVTIPNSVTSISDFTFYNCLGLTSLTIGNSVTSIGVSAFAGCSGLTDVYCLAKYVPETESYVFDDSTIGNATLHVPASALNAYKTTEPWSGFGTIVAFTEVIGDLNGDVKVDIADAVCVLDVMAKDVYDAKADLNEDGKIDIADFVCVLDIMAQQ